MKINYSSLPGTESTQILMPIVPIILINGKYDTPVYALVDSGATGGAISTVIADDLHIAWRNIPPRMGFSVGGNFRFHLVKIEAEIFDHRLPLAINVIEGISAFKCILGQKDLFQRAKITFEGYKNQFEITFREYN